MERRKKEGMRSHLVEVVNGCPDTVEESEAIGNALVHRRTRIDHKYDQHLGPSVSASEVQGCALCQNGTVLLTL